MTDARPTLAAVNTYRATLEMVPLSSLGARGESCDSCGSRLTAEAIDGGRCWCGAMVCALAPDAAEIPTQRVYVASFAPSYEEASSGGCEWRRTRKDAIAAFVELAEAEGFDLRLTVLDLPASMTADEIGDFLGGVGCEVVDPPDPRPDLDDALATWHGDGEETAR